MPPAVTIAPLVVPVDAVDAVPVSVPVLPTVHVPLVEPYNTVLVALAAPIALAADDVVVDLKNNAITCE